MELRIGYFPVLDAALALRQAFESIRFQPYNPAMEAIAERFSPADRDAIEGLGEGTGGWLQVIGALLERDAEGLLGLEEGLLRLEDAGEPAKARLAQVLRTGIAPEASRRARSLLEATAAIQPRGPGCGRLGLRPGALGPGLPGPVRGVRLPDQARDAGPRGRRGAHRPDAFPGGHAGG